MTPIELAVHYFDLSNASDMDAIRGLMHGSTTYSSSTTGVYLGVDAIMEMQTSFHGSFEKLHWFVHSVEEERPGVVRFDFTLTGRTVSGEEIRKDGIEYVIVHAGKIQHIEVRNR